MVLYGMLCGMWLTALVGMMCAHRFNQKIFLLNKWTTKIFSEPMNTYCIKSPPPLHHSNEFKCNVSCLSPRLTLFCSVFIKNIQSMSVDVKECSFRLYDGQFDFLSGERPCYCLYVLIRKYCTAINHHRIVIAKLLNFSTIFIHYHQGSKFSFQPPSSIIQPRTFYFHI